MKVERQSLSNRIVHALTASSIFMLIITGIGQMPAYKRYMVSDIPGLGWTGSYDITLWLHYLFAFVLMGVAAYHVSIHTLRREFDILPKRGDFKHSVLVIWAMIRGHREPPSEKYLPEQRLAYGFMVFAVGLVIVTGFIKMAKNLPGWNLSDGMHFWMAQLHNLGMVLVILGIVGHLSAFLFKPNRKLLPAMWHGKVCAHYTLDRHAHWHEGVRKANAVVAQHTELLHPVCEPDKPTQDEAR